MQLEPNPSMNDSEARNESMHLRFICQTLFAIEQQSGHTRQSDPLALPVGSKSPPVEGPPPVLLPLDPVEHDPIGDDPHPVKFSLIVAT